MRVKITLVPETEKQGINLNYNQFVSSWLYRTITLYRRDLEEKVFDNVDCFTFSKLMVPRRKYAIVHDKIFIDSDKVELYFSTILDEVGEAVTSQIEKSYALKIDGKRFFVDNVREFKEKKISSKMTFITMSPITVSGERGELLPNSVEFFEKIKRSLVRKAEKFGYEHEDELEMKVLKVKPKRISVFGKIIRCFEMVFEAKGCESLLEVGYKAGFGELNSFGFGMVKA